MRGKEFNPLNKKNKTNWSVIDWLVFFIYTHIGTL